MPGMPQMFLAAGYRVAAENARRRKNGDAGVVLGEDEAVVLVEPGGAARRGHRAQVELLGKIRCAVGGASLLQGVLHDTGSGASPVPHPLLDAQLAVFGHHGQVSFPLSLTRVYHLRFWPL